MATEAERWVGNRAPSEGTEEAVGAAITRRRKRSTDCSSVGGRPAGGALQDGRENEEWPGSQAGEIRSGPEGASGAS